MEAEGVDVLQDAARLREALGPEHPQTLATRTELAIGYLETHRIQEAIAELEDVLRLQVWVLGAVHEDTLWTQELLVSARKKRAES